MNLVPLKKSNLTRTQFQQLSDVPPEDEWLANITNLKNPASLQRRCVGVHRFTGLHDYLRLRSVVRANIIAWRKDMERRGLAGGKRVRLLGGRNRTLN